MAINLTITNFTIAPGEARTLLPNNPNRAYFFAFCQSGTLGLVFHDYDVPPGQDFGLNTDELQIGLTGFYEPWAVPSNSIAVHNPDTATDLVGFIITG